MFTTTMNKPKVRLPQNVQAGIYKADVIRVTLKNYIDAPTTNPCSRMWQNL